jgi:SAM-dependent methyltransferase
MTEHRRLDRPSSFVSDWGATLVDSVPPPRRALDIAMGNGRHAFALADVGYNVFGVDRRLDALQAAATHARGRGVDVKLWCADLTAYPLPAERFELVVVARYLQRDLFPALSGSLVPGGVMVYETFTESQRALGRGPTSPDHLLKAGELKSRFADLDIVFYEEVLAPDALARLVGRRPFSRA